MLTITTARVNIGKQLIFILFCSSFFHVSHALPFLVTNTNDSGMGSLRAAIQASNATSGLNAINFAIPLTDPGYDPITQTWVIKPLSDLDTITNSVVIDGYSQQGAQPNTLDAGDNAIIKIVINGSNYTIGDGGTSGIGLHFAFGADNSVITGLCINQWLLAGILIEVTAGPVIGISILGNFLGTNAAGTEQMANALGVGMSGLPNGIFDTTIGTIANNYRNIIAGSFGNATVFGGYTLVVGGISTIADISTVIVNNYIGVDVTGTKGLGNSLVGIGMTGSFLASIGGDVVQSRNIISGQTAFGIVLFQCEIANIQNNFIGTDVTGTLGGPELRNLNQGIFLLSSTVATTIQNNLVSNNGTGVHLGDSVTTGTEENSVIANLIGTDSTGLRPLGNTYGVEIYNANNVIGDFTQTTTNTISGNEYGILVSSQSAAGNIIINNSIGLDSQAKRPLANRRGGIFIGQNGGRAGASNNIVGM